MIDEVLYYKICVSHALTKLSQLLLIVVMFDELTLIHM